MGIGVESPAPIVVAQAHGARVIDVDNNVFLDFAGGGFGFEVGHTHEAIVGTSQAQVESLEMLPDGITVSEAQVRLCELLTAISPPLGGRKVTLLFPTPGAARDFIGGLPRPPALFDETEIGVGRTGALFAAEGEATPPAALLVGGGELPAALICRAEVVEAATLSGLLPTPPMLPTISPLACLRALETLALIQEQQLPRRAIQISEIVTAHLADWLQFAPPVQRWSNRGAFLTLHVDPAQTTQIIGGALQAGVLLRAAPTVPGAIPLKYPLMIPEEQLYEGLNVVEDVLRAAHAAQPTPTAQD
jgi:4-aminobutyrate aminotransferase/(S)-3-amino-2-methylpropionate transaminase